MNLWLEPSSFNPKGHTRPRNGRMSPVVEISILPFSIERVTYNSCHTPYPITSSLFIIWFWHRSKHPLNYDGSTVLLVAGAVDLE